MSAFNFNTSPKIRFGCGSINELGKVVNKLIGKNVLLVTDPGLVEIGLVNKVINILDNININYSIFSDVEADPSENTIYKACEQAKEKNVQGVLGFGGGSSMDVAKLTALLANGEEKLIDIYGVGNVKGNRFPLILIPTL